MYVSRRLATGALVVVIAIVLNFVLTYLAPGDPIRILSGKDNPSPQAEAALRDKYGLDQPITIQLAYYAANLLQGDLGESMLSERPVAEMIRERVGPTLLLTLTTAICSLVMGTALGMYCARRSGSRQDSVICALTYVFDAIPTFWLGMMSILLFASTLQWLPTAGMVDMRTEHEGFAYILDVLRHLCLPALTLILGNVPYFFRVARASALQVMTEDYVLMLRATGMKESRIFRKYVLRNALLPTIHLFGMSLAFIVTGVAMVEIVFSWPGMGSFMMNAISRRDYPLLMGLYLILSISVAVSMLLMDIVSAWIDPRIRYGQSI